MISLDDLVRPLGVERFTNEHWLPEVPFVSERNPELIARIRELDVFASPEALCARLTRDVALFGPNQFRGEALPSQALERLAEGFTIYALAIDEQILEVRALAREVAESLGSANMAVNVEAFIARAGSISSGHFDHDINFQILLDGEKRWNVAANRHVRNPLKPYHPALQPDGSYSATLDEAYARDPDVPVKMPPTELVLEAHAGSVVFMPRAWWHEVESLTPCFAINIGIKGATWATGFSVALGDLLSGDEIGREYCYGALASTPEERRRATDHFERVRRRAIEHLQAISLEEVYLADKSAAFEWTAEAKERAVVETSAGWGLHVPGVSTEPLDLDATLAGLLTKLVRLKHRFDWGQLLVIASAEIRGEVGAVGLWNLLADLVEGGYLSRHALKA